MDFQTYIEKPTAPRRVKAFQVPAGESITVTEASGNTLTATEGDYIELDSADAHVAAFKKDDFEARFTLDTGA
jgi:hypothetical protein